MATNSGLKSLFVTDLTDTRTAAQGDVEGVGSIRFDNDGKVYRWVKNNEAYALAVGVPVVHEWADTTTALQKVSVALTANLGFLAGVCISAIPTLGFGWIQIQGYNAACYVSGETETTTYAAGYYLKAVNATGTAMSTAYMTNDAATQPSYKRNIQMQAVLSTGTVSTARPVRINCFD